MRVVASLTAIAFGCTAARPSAMPPSEWMHTGRVALAEPQLELWMEGTERVDPAESSRALNQSRDALAQALSGRGLEAADPDDLLVVRARAIARTDERKTAQTWSYVGIVFVVVAVVVVAIVSSRSRSSPPPRNTVRPAGSGPIRPGPWAPAYLPHRYPPPPPFGIAFGLSVAVPQGPTPTPWQNPTDRWLASRGWFAGDAVELTVELTDARTGAVKWGRTLQDSVDPRDPATMTRLVDRALEGLPLGETGTGAGPLEAPLPPPPSTPAEGSPGTAEPRGASGVSGPGSEPSSGAPPGPEKP